MGYGESHVIHDVSLRVGADEAVAVMGRNGMGKTTLLKSLIGLLPLRSGDIALDGKPLGRLPSYRRVAAAWRSCRRAGWCSRCSPWSRTSSPAPSIRAIARCPTTSTASSRCCKEMEHRKGGNLSGGQQQMLAIARALISDPKVLILDEPTEGIQPSIIKELARTLNVLRKERRFAVVVSEQVLSFALDLADRFLVIDRGRIVHDEARATLDQEKVRSFLTV